MWGTISLIRRLSQGFSFHSMNELSLMPRVARTDDRTSVSGDAKRIEVCVERALRSLEVRGLYLYSYYSAFVVENCKWSSTF